jgi:ECF transporter S component (folate family)
MDSPAITEGIFMDKRQKTIGVKAIAYISVLTALSALANIFTVPLGGGSFAISFAYIPAFIAGAFINPLGGFLTGILGDLLGCIIAPKGAINPIILVTSGLLGLIPGLVFWIAKSRKIDTVRYSYVLTSISFILLLIICIPLNTIGLYLFYFRTKGKALGAVFALRMSKQSIILAFNFIITVIIQKPISKLIKI